MKGLGAVVDSEM